MKKNILFFLCIHIIVLNSFAQDSSSIDLNQLTVTANINPTDIRKTGRNVTIIDAKTIEKSPVKTLDGVLQYALNVDVRSRSPFGVQSDISIRGGHYDQTLIMIDGVKMNDPQTGHHSLNIPIPMSQIEKIEILQGGASRVFGPAAFSGVINIITKKETKSALEILALKGENKLNGTAIFGNLHFKNINVGVYTDDLSSKGYAYNTAFEKSTTFIKIDKTLNKGFFKVQGGWFSNDFGASNFYSPKFFEQYEEVKSKFISAHYLVNIKPKVISTINASYRIHNDLYDFNNYRKTNAYNSINFHETAVLGIDWKLRFSSMLGKSSLGYEFRKEDVLSNRLGELKTEKIKVPNYDVFYDKSKSRLNNSTYFEHQISLNKFQIVGGTLLNLNSQFGVEFFPGIDASLQLGEENSLYTSINKSTRFPTFTEMYLKGSTVIGDPELKPEKAISYELGHKYQGKNYSFIISAFYKQTVDAIDKISRLTQKIPTMENIDDINMFGLEFSGKVDLSKLIKSQGLVKFRSLDLNYAYLKADREEIGYQSFYTLNYLTNKLSLGLNSNLGKNTNLSIWYTNKYRAGSYQLDVNSPVITYKPINLIDVRLSKPIFSSLIFVDCNNLLNTEYFEFGFVAQPKRWLSAGLRLSI